MSILLGPRYCGETHEATQDCRRDHIPRRRWASALVGTARGSLVWGRGKVAEAEAALVAQLFIAESIFVASRAAQSATERFPTEQFLRSLLHDGEAYEWLASHDCDLPEWLA